MIAKGSGYADLPTGKICEKHNLSKENPFGSKGLFARYGKGPVGFYMAASSAVSVIFTGIAYVFVCLKAWAGAFGIGAVTKYISAVTKVYSSVSAVSPPLKICKTMLFF